MIVSVVVEVNNLALDKPFDYLVPLEYQNIIKVGSRVCIPFGKRTLEGFVVSIHKGFLDNLKEIIEVYDDFLNEEQLYLVKYLRKRNLAVLIECINTILPPALRASIKNRDKKKFVKYVRLLNHNHVLNDKEKALTQFLFDNSASLKTVNEMFGTYLVNKLRKLNVIEVYLNEEYRKTFSVNSCGIYETLNEAQENVVKGILQSSHPIHLIYGVTGSGKTVCYIELIKDCIKRNRQVLILVPEISLTPQLINIISYHIESEIAVFHSKMSTNERYDQYRLVQNNKVRVAIGTRSAVFLPFDNLGLIIIDEEHDSSFIQEQVVSYSAKEIALIRANYHKAKLVLGSATPDVVTYYNTLNRQITPHFLTSQYSNTVINTEVIDMKSNFDWILSKQLIDNIRNTLNSNKQFILILNRRGYANYLMCNECGSPLKCPFCNVTLTLHEDNTLKCHHCDHEHYDLICECKSTNLKEYGYGIQKVEELLKQEFSDLRIARIDADVTKKIKSVETVFNDFNNQLYDGLIGTQILSKGLNFLNVNLITILDADYALNIPSYKASENTFQYITQSLGRNNRGSSLISKNIVQTYDKSHYAFKAAINNDYIAFYSEEINYRRKMGYPPFNKYTKVLCTSANLSELIIHMDKIYNIITQEHLNATKPQFSTLERINKQYRMQILIKHSNISQLFGIINKIREINNNKFIKTIVNSNPVNF